MPLLSFQMLLGRHVSEFMCIYAEKDACIQTDKNRKRVQRDESIEVEVIYGAI